MNAREIENLRKKFIWVAFLSLVLAMFLVSLTIDFATYISSQRVIRQALDTIADAGGVVSEEEEQSPAELVNDPSFIEVFAPVLSSYSDYFVILCEEDAETVSVIWNHGGRTAYTQTAADSEDDGSEAAGEDRAPDYHGIAQRVIEDGRTYGRAGRLYYKLVKSDTGYVIAFLDASAEVTLFSRLLFLSGAACFIGFLITYILVRIFSRKMIEPEIENSRRQKQFITNASHELKTPLAVIRANTELSEMLHGEDEWSRSTMRQVDRMDGLIRSLVQKNRKMKHCPGGSMYRKPLKRLPCRILPSRKAMVFPLSARSRRIFLLPFRKARSNSLPRSFLTMRSNTVIRQGRSGSACRRESGIKGS